MPRLSVLSVSDMSTDYQRPSKSRHVSIVSSDDVNDLKIVEDAHVPFKTISIIEDI